MGRQEGLAYTDASGASHPTFPLAPDYQGCSHPDPDHSYLGGRVEYDGGACDGWLRAGSNFAQPKLSASAFSVPAGSFGSLCFPNARINNGAALLDFAASFGFPLPQ